jgi:hypothetical protein
MINDVKEEIQKFAFNLKQNMNKQVNDSKKIQTDG